MIQSCGSCRGRFGTNSRTLCVQSPSDLERLLRTYDAYDAVYIIKGMTSPDRESWENRLIAHYGDCGCELGGVAVVLALVVFALGAPAIPGWRTVMMALATCVIAAFVGKLIGIAIARLQLFRDIRILREHLVRQSI